MGSIAMIYIPILIKIDSGIQKYIVGIGGEGDTDTQHDDLISKCFLSKYGK
jgi:hypothetical protein